VAINEKKNGGTDMDNEPASPMTIGLRVSDMRHAIDFYKGIGFEPIMTVPNDRGDPVFCVMRYGLSSLVFDAVDTELPMPETKRERQMRKGPRGLGLKIGLEVPSIEPIYQHFMKTKCEITCEPMEEFWCDWLFTGIDPYGYEWQFTQGSKPMTAGDQVDAAKQEWGL
jgi:uncharacterized glyoxalase superfamily protein PhnB